MTTSWALCGPPAPQIGVVIEPTPAAQITPLLLNAYGLPAEPKIHDRGRAGRRHRNMGNVAGKLGNRSRSPMRARRHTVALT
jgi:hypothetical protein